MCVDLNLNYNLWLNTKKDHDIILELKRIWELQSFKVAVLVATQTGLSTQNSLTVMQ